LDKTEITWFEQWTIWLAQQVTWSAQ